MTCGDFEHTIREAARGRAPIDHTRNCEGCARKLEAERRLVDAFQAIADETADAPAHLEAKLVAGFRSQRRRPAAHWYGWVGAAIAAAALIAVFLPQRSATERTPKPVIAQQAPVKAAPEPMAPAVIPVTKPAKPRNYARRPTRSTIDGRGFIPVLYGADIPTSGQVIRVSLPRTALVSFGLPMNEFRTAERVQADVLIGDDGLARAVRFRP